MSTSTHAGGRRSYTHASQIDANQGNSQDQAPPLVAQPWVYIDPIKIQPRGWVLGTLLILGGVTALGSAGGVGKTALAITMALACITGRDDILGMHVFQRCNVWFLTLEDDRRELERRIAAAMIAHNIKPEDIAGKLFINSASDRPLLLAKQDENGEFFECPDAAALRDGIITRQIGLTVIDPLVKAHRLNENNNQQMDKLGALAIGMARQTTTSLLLPSHFRKGSGDHGQDMFRGASSWVDAVRINRTLLQMTPQQAPVFNVNPDTAADYIRLNDVKSNMAPRAAATWFELRNCNTEIDPRYPAGDHVQAVARWYPPSPFAGLTIQAIADIFERIRQGPEPGEFYTPRPNAQDWAGALIVAAGKNDKQATAVVDTWTKTGVLLKDRYSSPKRDRRKVERVTLNETKAADILAPFRPVVDNEE